MTTQEQITRLENGAGALPEWARKARIAELSKKRRNQSARARYAAMRSIGMVKTPYGWE